MLQSLFQFSQDDQRMVIIKDLFEQHSCHVDGGAITLPDGMADRATFVKNFLKQEFNNLLDVFGIEKNDLVPRQAPPKASSAAISFFSIKTQLESGTLSIPGDESLAIQEKGSRLLPGGEVQGNPPAPVNVSVHHPSLPVDANTVARVPSPSREEKIPHAVVKQDLPPSNVLPEEQEYSFYVCNRCGNEISRFDIETLGDFLECPRCRFRFSRTEARIVQKKIAPVQINVLSESSTPTRYNFNNQEELVKPSQLFQPEASPGDPSLIKPSDLFGTPGPVLVPEPEAGLPPASRRAARRVINPTSGRNLGEASHDDSLVRPSMFLEGGQQDVVDSTGPASVEEQTFVNKNGGDSSEHLVRPSQLLDKERDQNLDSSKCPFCNSPKYTKVQDRSKVISYNPLIYGTRKKCTSCSKEFD